MNDATSRGIPVNLAVYQQDPVTCMQNSVLAADHIEQDSTKAEKPERFDYANWITWEESVEVYLESAIDVKDMTSLIILKIPKNSSNRYPKHIQQHLLNSF